MTEKQEKVLKGVQEKTLERAIKSEPKHDIKRHQEATRELPTDNKVRNPFTSNQDNSGRPSSKKKR